MAKKQTEVETPLATTQSTMLPAPSYIESSRQGFELVNPTDFVFERLTLMQALSPEVAERKYEQGMLIRRLTNEVLYAPGSEELKFTPAFYFKEFVEFGDRDNPNDPIVVRRSLDHKSELAELSRQRKKKKLANGKDDFISHAVHNFVVLFDIKPREPFLLGFARSNARHGAGLLARLNGRGDYPIYAGSYRLFTELETNRRQQKYQVIKAHDDMESPWASDAMYKNAKYLYESLSKAYAEGKLGGSYDAEDSNSAGPEPDTSGL